MMVSVGVSSLGRTSIHFVEPGVKINRQYYRDVLLMEDLLPEIREFSEFYVFQQDGAPVHRARETVALLTNETPDFILPTLWPPNSRDLNPVNYQIWGCKQEMVYKAKVRDVEDLRIREPCKLGTILTNELLSAVRERRKRLRACVEAEGGQFE